MTQSETRTTVSGPSPDRLTRTRVALDGVQAQRRLAHLWVQVLGDLARANLAPHPDDGHTALGWDPNALALRTAPIATDQGPVHLALEFEGLSLAFYRGETRAGRLAIAGLSVAQVQPWLDSEAIELGLTPGRASARPYALPDEASIAVDPAPTHLKALGAWFALAHKALSALGLDGPVRVWPHHFDMAIYLRLGPGEAETAPGVGLGLSPGDPHSDTPYLYVGPWPRLTAEEFGAAPPHGVVDPVFGGYMLRAAPLLAATDQSAAVLAFFQAGLKMARTVRAA